jgi:hypothetical protein
MGLMTFIRVDYPSKLLILVHINAIFTGVQNLLHSDLIFLPAENLAALVDEDFAFIVRHHDASEMGTPFSGDFDILLVA